jgi:hypothetical protein
LNLLPAGVFGAMRSLNVFAAVSGSSTLTW